MTRLRPVLLTSVATVAGQHHRDDKAGETDSVWEQSWLSIHLFCLSFRAQCAVFDSVAAISPAIEQCEISEPNH